jgi:hypothetical protein
MLNSKLASTLGVDQITVSATLFKGKLSTLPCKELVDISFVELMEHVVPQEPQLNTDKDRLTYFVGCALKEAELVGKTREKAHKEGRSTIGKQRSSNHVTAGKVVKLDLDGIMKPESKKLLAKLKALGLAYALYTTFSHGDKPNIRARLLMALDRNLSPQEYKAAVLALSKELLGQSLDESEALLSQQASIYCAHPDRAGNARRRVQIEGKCISADYLLTLVPASTLETYAQSSIATHQVIPIDLDKLGDAFRWLDPNSYNEWMKVGQCLKALEPSLDEIEADMAFKLWIIFSEEACDDKKARNELSQYNPEIMFDQFKPSMTADAAMGTLMGIAKRRSLEVAKAENLTTADDPTLSVKGFEAIKHLKKYHPREIQLLMEASFCKEYV